MCGFLTPGILIDEVNNYTGVILRTARFDLNCPLFTCLDFWHRLSSIVPGMDKNVNWNKFYIWFWISNMNNVNPHNFYLLGIPIEIYYDR